MPQSDLPSPPPLNTPALSLYQQPSIARLWPADQRLNALFDFFDCEIAAILSDSRDEISVPPIIPYRLLRTVLDRRLSDEEASRRLDALSATVVDFEISMLGGAVIDSDDDDDGASVQEKSSTEGESPLWEWWDLEEFNSVKNFSILPGQHNVRTAFDSNNDPEVPSGYTSDPESPKATVQRASGPNPPPKTGSPVDAWIKFWKYSVHRPKGLSFIASHPRHLKQAECDRWIRSLKLGAEGKVVQMGFSRALAHPLERILDDIHSLISDVVHGDLVLPDMPSATHNSFPQWSWPDSFSLDISNDAFYREVLMFLIAVRITRPQLIIMSAWAHRHWAAHRAGRNLFNRVAAMRSPSPHIQILTPPRPPSPEPSNSSHQSHRRSRSPSAAPPPKRLRLMDRLQ